MWHKFSAMFLVLATVPCAALSGCSLFGEQLDKAAEGAGKLVTFYCENVTDDAAREQFRAAVNAKAAPHSVAVTCADGRPPLISSAPPPVDNAERSP